MFKFASSLFWSGVEWSGAPHSITLDWIESDRLLFGREFHSLWNIHLLCPVSLIALSVPSCARLTNIPLN